MISLTRRYALPAAHVLAHPSLSAKENDRIYGKCANPLGHGHDYGLEVSVSGPIDPLSGRIVDPEVLDAIVEAASRLTGIAASTVRIEREGVLVPLASTRVDQRRERKPPGCHECPGR